MAKSLVQQVISRARQPIDDDVDLQGCDAVASDGTRVCASGAPGLVHVILIEEAQAARGVRPSVQIADGSSSSRQAQLLRLERSDAHGTCEGAVARRDRGS